MVERPGISEATSDFAYPTGQSGYRRHDGAGGADFCGKEWRLGGRDEGTGYSGDRLGDSSVGTVSGVNAVGTHSAQNRGGRAAWGSRVAALGMLLLAWLLGGCGDPQPDNHSLVAAAATARAAEVTVEGRVVRVLADDENPQGRHERFLLQVAGLIVEVDHNLTLAPRVPVTVGATVIVHGQFEPDPGHPVIHYTHHATGAHEGGWIKLLGRRYG